LGLLDFLRREKRDAVAPAEERDLTAGELEAVLREGERGVLAPFVKAGFGLEEKIGEGLRGTARAAARLEDAEPSGQWSGIGKDMKKKFLERVPAALAVPAPQERTYEALAEFQRRAFAAMAAASKIVSDNRYLLHFFPKEMSEFNSRAKETVSLLDELGKKLAEGAGAAAAFREAKAALEKKRRVEGKILLLEKEAEGLSGAGEKTGGTKTQPRERPARKELAEVDAQIASARAWLAGVVNPMERPLRKLEKICQDKAVASSAKEFASDPVAAVVENGAGGLRTLAAELEKELGGGRLESDAKKRGKMLEHVKAIDFGEVGERARELGALARRKAEAQERARREDLEEKAAEDARLRAVEAARKREGLLGEIGEKRRELRDAVKELEESAGRALGARIKIVG